MGIKHLLKETLFDTNINILKIPFVAIVCEIIFELKKNVFNLAKKEP